MKLKSSYQNYTFITLSYNVLRVMRNDGYVVDISVGEIYQTQKNKISVRIVKLQNQYHNGNVGYYLKSTAVDPTESKGKDITAHGILKTLIEQGKATKLDSQEFKKLEQSTIKKVEAEIKRRTAQKEFRRIGLEYYKACIVTNTQLHCALDAAHIEQANGYNDTLSNCLILRSDWHKLFDSYLWSIIPKSNTVILSKIMLDDPAYAEFNGKLLTIKIDNKYLQKHYREFKKSNKV